MNNELRQKLTNVCSARMKHFLPLGDVTHTDHGPLIHIDRGADVLAIAHLDTVLVDEPEWVGDYEIRTGMLDDRLGAWTILNLLPSLGCPNYDILLTDSEEIGQSTAQYFEATDRYNWMFEFDRAGMDVVMYEYETDDYENLLIEEGFKVGSGAFTDICYLNQLEVTGFNFGVGYHQAHSTQCHADIRDTQCMAFHFVDFMKRHKDTKMPFDKSNAYRRWRGWGGQRWNSHSEYFGSNKSSSGGSMSGFHSTGSHAWLWGDDEADDGADVPLTNGSRWGNGDIAICPNCYEPVHYGVTDCQFCGEPIKEEDLLEECSDEELERGWTEYLNQIEQNGGVS